jgi:hypothetical protein
VTYQEWTGIADRIALIWATPPMTPERRATYFDVLRDLEAGRVRRAVDGLMREDHERVPPPGIIRSRVTGSPTEGQTRPAASAPPGGTGQATPQPVTPGRPAALPWADAPYPSATPAPAPAPATAPSPFSNPLVIGTCTAAAVAFIGCLLPWVTVFGGSIAGTRTDDGKIVLVLSILGLACYSLAGWRVVFACIQAVLGLLVALIGIYDTIDIERTLSDLDAFGAGAGVGVYLVLIAGIAWVALALLSVRRP